MRNRYYLTFTYDHDEEDAKRIFFKKYGVMPNEIFRDIRNNLCLGPVPEKNEEE